MIIVKPYRWIMSILAPSFLALALPAQEVISAAYATSWDKSEWRVVKGDLHCSLEHPIAGLGVATLSRRSGGSDQLKIETNFSGNSGRYEIVSRAPMWKQDVEGHFIGQASYASSIDVSGELLRKILSQLGQNLHVDFVQLESASLTNSVSKQFVISLSPKNFASAHRDYNSCVKQMIPYSFQQVAKWTYQYATDATSLSDATRRHLDKMLRYSGADKNVIGFIIDAHSDALATPELGLNQAQFQGELVARYLTDQGFSAEQIISRIHGDQFPIASNANNQGKAKNRRVTVRLEDHQLRRAREEKVASRIKFEERESARILLETEHKEAREAEQKRQEEARSEAAKTAMKANSVSSMGATTIRKYRPGITIEEFQQMVEGQDLRTAKQPVIIVENP